MKTCGSCKAGVVVINNTEIQTCDTCRIFETDEDAANAVDCLLDLLHAEYSRGRTSCADAFERLERAARRKVAGVPLDAPVPDSLEKIEARLLHRPCALVAAGAKVRCLTAEKREGRISVWNVKTRRMCGECAAYVHVMRAKMALSGRGVPEPAADRRSVCGYQGCGATATRPDPFGGRNVCADCEEELNRLLCERPQS